MGTVHHLICVCSSRANIDKLWIVSVGVLESTQQLISVGEELRADTPTELRASLPVGKESSGASRDTKKSWHFHFLFPSKKQRTKLAISDCEKDLIR